MNFEEEGSYVNKDLPQSTIDKDKSNICDQAIIEDNNNSYNRNNAENDLKYNQSQESIKKVLSDLDNVENANNMVSYIEGDDDAIGKEDYQNNNEMVL